MGVEHQTKVGIFDPLGGAQTEGTGVDQTKVGIFDPLGGAQTDGTGVEHQTKVGIFDPGGLTSALAGKNR